MSFCQHCGSQLGNGAAFCSACGQSQNASAIPQVPVYTVAHPQYVTPQYGVPVQYNEPDTYIPGKGVGIPSMIFGILALTLFVFWFVDGAFIIISLIFSVISIILGAIGKSKAASVGKSNGMASAGIACSCVTLGIFTFFLLLYLSMDGETSYSFWEF